MRRMAYWRGLALAVVLAPSLASAQWITQQIDLEPGWNAVFVEVDPAEPSPEIIFGGVAVESVWAWNRRFESAKYLTNPNELLPKSEDWLSWFPPGSPRDALSDLSAITGSKAFLIELGGSTPQTVSIKGRPSNRFLEYTPDSLNFVGFTVSRSSPPTFAQFFAPSGAHAGQAVYRLDPATGSYGAVNPVTATMRRGEAFWVFTSGASAYQGPLEVAFPTSEGFAFGRNARTLELKISNLASAARTMTLAWGASETAEPGFPLLAGDLPLSRYLVDIPNGKAGFEPIAGPLTVAVAAMDSAAVSLEPRRKDMAPFTVPANETAEYQSVLTISDGAGFERVLGFSAKGSGPGGGTRATRGANDLGLRPGLWVGTVSINGVSQPANGVISGNTDPQPVGSEATFRIIMHVDENEVPRLLSDVVMMFREGTSTVDGDGNTVVVDPSRYVLVTDKALLPQFQGLVLSDGQAVGRRVSTSAFSFRTPQQMTVTTAPEGQRADVSITIDYDDPLNPYKHKYHPDHDNLSEQFDQTFAAGVESYDITRAIGLTFTAVDPSGVNSAGYGDTVAAGIYSETIIGIHKDPINVGGTFRLENISNVEVLNDGL